jgi:hypothetical protein
MQIAFKYPETDPVVSTSINVPFSQCLCPVHSVETHTHAGIHHVKFVLLTSHSQSFATHSCESSGGAAARRGSARQKRETIETIKQRRYAAPQEQVNMQTGFRGRARRAVQRYLIS